MCRVPASGPPTPLRSSCHWKILWPAASCVGAGLCRGTKLRWSMPSLKLSPRYPPSNLTWISVVSSSRAVSRKAAHSFIYPTGRCSAWLDCGAMSPAAHASSCSPPRRTTPSHRSTIGCRSCSGRNNIQTGCAATFLKCWLRQINRHWRSFRNNPNCSNAASIPRASGTPSKTDTPSTLRHRLRPRS